MTSLCDIANALADVFYKYFSAFSTDAFTYVCHKGNKCNLNVSSENVEMYNSSLSMQALQAALRGAHDTSPISY